jgi:hypothetical protein
MQHRALAGSASSLSSPLFSSSLCEDDASSTEARATPTGGGGALPPLNRQMERRSRRTTRRCVRLPSYVEEEEVAEVVFTPIESPAPPYAGRGRSALPRKAVEPFRWPAAGSLTFPSHLSRMEKEESAACR